MPLVAVVTPAYRAEQTISGTIRSVQSQTCPDWIHIVVDDGSDDRTVAVARGAVGERTDCRVVAAPRRGLPGAVRNHAISVADSEWVAFLDADDEWEPGYLASVVELAQRTGADVVHTGAVNVTGNSTSLAPQALDLPRFCPAPVMAYYMRPNPVYNSSVIVRRSVVERVGGLSERAENFTNDDFDFLIRVAPFYAFAYDNRPLLRYRLSPEGITFASGNWEPNLRGAIATMDRTLRAVELPAGVVGHYTAIRDRFSVMLAIGLARSRRWSESERVLQRVPPRRVLSYGGERLLCRLTRQPAGRRR